MSKLGRKSIFSKFKTVYSLYIMTTLGESFTFVAGNANIIFEFWGDETIGRIGYVTDIVNIILFPTRQSQA